MSKYTENSKTKIIERKLESLFTKRKSKSIHLIKKFASTVHKKREIADLLGCCILRLLNKKNEVYSVFYQLRHKKDIKGRHL